MLRKHPIAIALLAGAASATGFAPLGYWPVTLAALALWIHLLLGEKGRWRTFLIGWAFGVAHFSVGLNWIAKAFTFQEAMPHWLGYVAPVLLSFYLAVYPGLAALGARWIIALRKRESGEPVLLFALALGGSWIVTEWLRSWVFSGFIWNPLSASLPDIFWADTQWIGTYGLSALSILLAGAIVALSQFRARPARQTAMLVTAVLLFSALHWIGSDTQQASAYETTETPITVVQPNIGQQDKWKAGYEQRNFAKLAGLTRRDDDVPRLIFWPEAAIPDYFEDGYPLRYYYGQPPESVRARMQRLMKQGDILLLGGLALEFDDGEGERRRLIGARNAVFAMDAQGELLDRYDKAHLVPYGEYLPMRPVLETIGLSRLVPGDLDFWPGPGPRSIEIGRFGHVGLQVCYEIIFSGQVIDRANRPDFIFNPSNDAWFGSWGPPQHLAQSRMRAVEEGLPVIRSTPTGISAVIDADGIVRDALPMGQAGRIDTMLPPPHPPTLFARFGNILSLGLALLLLISAIALAARRR